MTTREELIKAFEAEMIADSDAEYITVYAFDPEKDIKNVYDLDVYAEDITDTGVDYYSYDCLYLDEDEAFATQEEAYAEAHRFEDAVCRAEAWYEYHRYL